MTTWQPVTFTRRDAVIWYEHLDYPIILPHRELMVFANLDIPLWSMTDRLRGETTPLHVIGQTMQIADEVGIHGGDGASRDDPMTRVRLGQGLRRAGETDDDRS